MKNKSNGKIRSKCLKWLCKAKDFAVEKFNRFKNTSFSKWLYKYIISPLVAFYKHKFLLCLVTAIVVNFIIELASRRSFSRLMLHVVDNFPMFLFGSSVIALSFCLSMLFKRRLFVYSVVLVVWISLGISNVSMLLNRANPLMLIDFKIMRSGMSLSTMYLTIPTIILLSITVITFIVGLVFLYKKSPREPVNYKRSVAFTLCVAFLVGGLASVFSIYKVVSPNQRLPEDYNNCGFVYCLLYGIVDSGIDKPDGYDKSTIDDIKLVVDSVKETIPEELPNVIVLQLESFMDMNRIEGIEFSENPHPYFSELKEKYPSGMLTVNALGSCTANVEYEVLTGTDIRSYGFDDYPYLSFLQNNSMESIAYNLRNIGYTTTAIHNHNGGFYGRNEAYTNLGFDRFIPLEAFGELTEEDYTYSKYWARDEILLDQIKGAMSLSEGVDMLLTVTVQCHSKYHTRYLEDFDYPVEVGGFEEDEVYTNMLLYYAAMAREEDIFIKELLTYLESLDEETIVMMYGDHLPTFIEGSEQLVDYNDGENPNAKYNSEYVIWHTDGINLKEGYERIRDIKSYELTAYALDLAGIRTGNIARLYHAGLSDEMLIEYRNALAYDFLEGENYYFEGKSPYKKIDTSVGLIPAAVTGYETDPETGTLFVKGVGFNPSSFVYINGGRYSTEYISSELLEVTEQVTIENGDKISVRLLTKDLVLLDQSEEFYVGDLPSGEKLTANKGKAGFHFTFKLAIIIVAMIIVIVTAVTVFIKLCKSKRNKTPKEITLKEE
ncbi:MAG: sulfatase-like hydrolase/transferase [Clostridia bacterium]|nr:sulfatase-like hydrolase/transferase [Clostridia bacterium]